MFVRRTTRDDPWVPVKVALFLLGALLALVGMSLENDWVIAAAAVLLLAGIALRFVPRRRPPDPPSDAA